MNEKKATPINEAAPSNSHAESKASDNSAAAQRAKALDLLRTGPKSTRARCNCAAMATSWHRQRASWN